jgi:hypothetical protein
MQQKAVSARTKIILKREFIFAYLFLPEWRCFSPVFADWIDEESSIDKESSIHRSILGASP